MKTSDDTTDYGVELNKRIQRLLKELNVKREELHRLEDELHELVTEKEECRQECGKCGDCSMCLG